MEQFIINNAVSVFGATGAFFIFLIAIIIYFSFKLGKKQIPDTYNTSKVQCNLYEKEMHKRGFPFQVLEVTHCNTKAISTNCIFWSPKKKCQLDDSKKCKFFIS